MVDRTHVHGVGSGGVLVQHDRGCLRQTARRDHVFHAVVFKLLADVLRIRLADRQARVEVRIGRRSCRIVDVNPALAEVTGDFLCSRHGVDHGHGLHVGQPFVVEKEECLTRVLDRAAHRCAEVILHQKIGHAHVVE